MLNRIPKLVGRSSIAREVNNLKKRTIKQVYGQHFAPQLGPQSGSNQGSHTKIVSKRERETNQMSEKIKAGKEVFSSSSSFSSFSVEGGRIKGHKL